MENLLFTYGMITVTCIISFIAFQSRKLTDELLFSTSKIIREHEYHRLFSSVFIHAGFGHLLFNMISFYSFAMSIEYVYGLKNTAFIYLSSGLGGSLLSLLLNRKNMDYLALGASGAVSGIIFASIFLIPGGSVYIFLIPFPVPAWIFAILFVLGSIYGIDRHVGNIGHDAHLGGALTGILVTGMIKPLALMHNPLLLAGIVIPSIIFLIYVHFKVR